MLSKQDVIEFLEQTDSNYTVITIISDLLGISGIIIKKENYKRIIEQLKADTTFGTRILSIEATEGLNNPDSEFYNKIKNEIKIFIVKFKLKNCLCIIRKQIQMTISENEDVTKRVENCLKKFGIEFDSIISIEEKKER